MTTMVEPVYNTIVDKTYNMIDDQNRIVSMQYPTYCSGSSPDRQNIAIGTGVFIYINTAEAQRFKPTDRCLKSVTLKVKRITETVTADFYVEIRADSGGLPAGDPQSPSNRLGLAAIIPYINIPTTFTEITVDLNIVLPNTDHVWIVTCINQYSPGDPIGDSFYRLDGGPGPANVGEYEAYKIGAASWVQTTETNYFKTNRGTYTSCAPMTVSMTIP